MKQIFNGSVVFVVALWPATALAQSFQPFADANVWTRYSFGPTQIIWFAAAILIGAIGYFLYYRGLLRMELRRIPHPLEPGRQRMSAAAFALLLAAVVLALAGFGIAYVLVLAGLAAIMDLLGGRRWVFAVASLSIIGMIVWALFFAG